MEDKLVKELGGPAKTCGPSGLGCKFSILRMIHETLMSKDDIDIIAFHSGEEIVDLHLYIGERYYGHISAELWQVLYEENLGTKPESLIAAAEFCEQCKEGS